MYLYIIGFLILIVIYELYKSHLRSIRRRVVYNKAVITAQNKHKKLLVIGDPDNGGHNMIFGRDYDCGDVCLDLVGCKNCENSMKAKIEDALPTFEDNSYVIFLSCVLEYIDKKSISFVLKELKRVSGGDLFIVTVDPHTITALFYPTRFLTGESSAKRLIKVEDMENVDIDKMDIKEFSN
jgi:hypothetical protein